MSNYIPNNEHFLKRVRNIRNELLNETDRFFFWVRSPPTLTHKTCLLSAVGDLK